MRRYGLRADVSITITGWFEAKKFVRYLSSRIGRGMMMKSSRVAAIFRSAVLYNRLINRLVKRARRVGYGAGLASPIINFPVFKRAPVRFVRITNLLFPRTSATNDL